MLVSSVRSRDALKSYTMNSHSVLIYKTEEKIKARLHHTKVQLGYLQSNNGLAVPYLSHFVKLVLNDTFYCACKYDNTVDARLLLFVLYSFLVILLWLVLLHLECE